MSESLEATGALLRAFSQLRDRSGQQRRDRLDALFTEFEALPEGDRRHRRGELNLFSLFNLAKSEASHRQFLAWLLDPSGSHAQGSLFAKTLISCCDVELPPTAIERGYRVVKEGSSYEFTPGMTLYRSGQFLIVIEANLFGREDARQLERQFLEMRRFGFAQKIPNSRQFALFLTPQTRGDRPSDPRNWHFLSYGDLARAFSEILSEIDRVKVKLLLIDWIEIVSQF